jgi:hypothetical protein
VSSQLVVIIDDSATHLKILERLAKSLGRTNTKTSMPIWRCRFAASSAPI